MINAYPIQWPVGWKRTARPSVSRFKVSLGHARTQVLGELRLLKAKNVIINSNLITRPDGLPYANQPRIRDNGIVVYFELNGSQQCIPCDKWDRIECNLRAIALTVGALRGIDRWGAKEMVDAAFSGFKALPAPSEVTSSSVRYFDDCASLELARVRFKNLVKELHPDSGGNQDEFIDMNNQYEQFRSKWK